MTTARRPKRLGLTGGIGSGKSTVADMLRQRGAYLIDADAVSRSVTAAHGIAIPMLRDAFGADMLDATGALDRNKMRALVFNDPFAKARLESIVHPLVGQEIEKRYQQAVAGHSVCAVFDIPLLVESQKWRPVLDGVLVIDCLEETQVTRVMMRNGLAQQEVATILANQASRHARLAAADWVLFNDGVNLKGLEALVGQIAADFGL